MAVHRRMLNEGYTPNATTYNALISAYGKAGQLDKVMEVCPALLALLALLNATDHKSEGIILAEAEVCIWFCMIT